MSKADDAQKLFMIHVGDASSQPLFLGLVAAIIGFGGFKIFTGQQGEVASKPSKAVRVAKRQVQARLDLQVSHHSFQLIE